MSTKKRASKVSSGATDGMPPEFKAEVQAAIGEHEIDVQYGWVLFQDGDRAEALPILQSAYKRTGDPFAAALLSDLAGQGDEHGRNQSYDLAFLFAFEALSKPCR